MRSLRSIMLLAGVATAFTACSGTPPKAVEVKDVCSQPAGTNVTINGYFSLPKQMEVTRYTRGGEGAGISYKLILMTKQDATGDAVFVNMSGTSKPDPNKIKMLPDNYTWKDLIAYTHDNKTAVAADPVQLTGTVELSDKDKCKVNVSRIARS